MDARPRHRRVTAAIATLLAPSLLAVLLVASAPSSRAAGAAEEVSSAGSASLEAPQGASVEEGLIVETQVVETTDGDLWTAATFLSFEHNELRTLIWLGGSDPTSGRFLIASHTPGLVPGDRAVLTLVPAAAELVALFESTGVAQENEGEQLLQVWGGRAGVELIVPTDQPTPRQTLPATLFTGRAWVEPNINWYLNPNMAAILPNAEAITQRSVQVWENEPGSRVRFFRQPGTANPDPNAFDSDSILAMPLSAGLLGEAVWVGVGQEISNFEIRINSATLPGASPWFDGAAPGTFDLESVIVHEMGHVLGLAHSNDAASVMSVPLVAGEPRADLSASDKLAIQQLYPNSAPTATPVPTTDPTPTPTPNPAQFSCSNPPPQAIIGTAGPDTITGTDGDDWIFGNAGDDVIAAGAGNDHICGGGGQDTIFGQDGNDFIDGGADADRLRGGDDSDTIYGGGGADDINGGRDDDTIAGGSGDDLLRGGTGNDSLDGNDGNDKMNGNGGTDHVDGNAGNDEVIGGPRPDTVIGGEGNDIVRGLGGADALYGQGGDDQLLGGKQPERVIDGGSGIDNCNGGADNDLLSVVARCEVISNVS